MMNLNSKVGMVALAVVLGASWTRLNAQLSQIRFPANLITHDDLVKDRLPGIQSWRKAYEKYNEDSDEIRPLARDFVALATAKSTYWTYSDIGRQNLDDPVYLRLGETLGLAERLVKAGCKDPLVLLFAADEMKAVDRVDEQTRLLDEAIERLQFSKYPRGLRLFFLQRRQQVNVDRNRINKDLEREIYANIPDWIKLRTEICPASQRATWRLAAYAIDLHTQPQFDVLETVAEKMMADKSLDPWTANMFRAEVCHRRAWKGRAGARRVSEEFSNDMRKASKHFRIAHKLHPEHPNAAGYLIDIAMSGHDNESEATWFQRAIEAQFDYEFAYDRMLWSLRPEWGGSNKQKLAFGKLCAETEQYATMMPLKLFKAFSDVKQKGVDWTTLMADPEQYKLATKVLLETLDIVETAASKGNQELNKQWLDQKILELKSNLVGVAFNARDFGAAAKFWDDVGDNAGSVMAFYGLDNKISRSIAAAYQEFGDELQAVPASQLAEPTMEDQARRLTKHLESLLEKTKGPQSRLALETWLHRARQSVQYESGNWTDLEFQKELGQWEGNRDRMQYLDPASVRINLESSSAFQTQCAGVFLGPKEISFELSNWKAIDVAGKFGLTIGDYKAVYAFHSDQSDMDHTSRYFYADLPNTIGVARFGEQIETKKIKDRIHKFHVRVWGPYYEIFVNDKFVTSGESEGFDATRPHIGFCQDPKFRVKGEIRLSNVRIRKIDFDPPNKDADAESKSQYLSDEIKRYPRRYELLYQRGRENYNTNQLGDAITDLRRAAVVNHSSPQPNDLLAKAAAKAGLFELALNQQKVGIAKVHGNGPYKGLLMAAHALSLATIPDDKLRDGEVALKMAEESIKLKPKDNPINWLAIAAAQAELGDFDEATKAVRAAKNLNTYDYNNYLIGEVEKAIEKGQPYRVKVQPDHEILKASELAKLLFPATEFESPHQKAKLVNQITESAHNTLGDDELKRALLERSVEFASGSAMVGVAFEVIDELQSEFDIDANKARMNSIKIGIENCPATSHDKTEITNVATKVIESYVKQDEYEAAIEFLTVFRSASAKWADVELSEDLQKRADNLKQYQSKFVAVKTAMKTLADNPNDNRANGVVGRYRLFTRGDWDRGLTYLAKCDDIDLASVAKKELAGVAGDAKIDVAKQWDALARKSTNDVEKQFCLSRALSWYAGGACVAKEALAKSSHERGAEIFKQGVTQTLVHPDRTPNTTTKPHQFMHFADPPMRFRDARNAVSSGLGLPNWIDVDKHSLSGEWQLIQDKRKKFQSPRGVKAKLLLPVVAPEEYDLDLTVKPIDGDDKSGHRTLFITLGGPDGSRFQIAFNAHEDRAFTGLERLDGKQCFENETRSLKSRFKFNQESQLWIRVRKTGIFVRVNGDQAISWQGDFSRLTTDPLWEDPRGIGLVVATDDSEFIVSSILLRPKAEIRILKAEFGEGKKWADVTQKVVEKFNRHDGGLWNGPNTLKKDPSPGMKKKTKIRFKRDGKEVTTWLNREGWFNLHKHIR